MVPVEPVKDVPWTKSARTGTREHQGRTVLCRAVYCDEGTYYTYCTFTYMYIALRMVTHPRSKIDILPTCYGQCHACCMLFAVQPTRTRTNVGSLSCYRHHQTSSLLQPLAARGDGRSVVLHTSQRRRCYYYTCTLYSYFNLPALAVSDRKEAVYVVGSTRAVPGEFAT